jgi:phage terminase small subunit
MPTRGRKPKPTALHVLQGTFEPSRHAKRASEPKPPPARLENLICPDGASPAVRARWAWVLRHSAPGVLAVIDGATLFAWCVCVEQHAAAVRAQAKLDAEEGALPLVRKGTEGGLVLSPYVRIIRDTALVMSRLGAEMGFTPASRPRLVAVAPGPAPKRTPKTEAPSDPWEGFSAPDYRSPPS